MHTHNKDQTLRVKNIFFRAHYALSYNLLLKNYTKSENKAPEKHIHTARL